MTALWGSTEDLVTVTEFQNGHFLHEPDPTRVGSSVQDGAAAHGHGTISLKPSLGQCCAPADEL